MGLLRVQAFGDKLAQAFSPPCAIDCPQARFQLTAAGREKQMAATNVFVIYMCIYILNVILNAEMLYLNAWSKIDQVEKEALF